MSSTYVLSSAECFDVFAREAGDLVKSINFRVCLTFPRVRQTTPPDQTNSRLVPFESWFVVACFPHFRAVVLNFPVNPTSLETLDC